MCCTESRIKEFKEKIGFDKEITREEFTKAVEGAMKDRALIFYFIYKTLQKLHPDIDADAVMAEASHAYGSYKSQFLGDVKTAADALLNQTSKTGMLAFNQTITVADDDYAEKLIHNCPLVNAFKEVGCSDEEIAKLCTKLLMPGDFALLEPYKGIELSFPKNLAEHDVCMMCIKKI